MKITTPAYFILALSHFTNKTKHFRLLTTLIFCFLTVNLLAQSIAPDYAAILSQADQAFSAKDYATSLMLYEKAGRIKSGDKKSASRIEEINNIFLAQPQLKAQLIEDIIIKAEDFFGKKNFAAAKNEYQKALALDPSAQYPKDRLTEISRVYIDPSDQVYFDNSMADGDKYLAASEYTKAIQLYETALTVKSDSKIAKDKIVNAKKMQIEAESREKQGVAILTNADKLYALGKQLEAKVEYEKALALTPKNTSIQQKINTINQALEEKNTKQLAFDKAIEEADNYYINRDFASARTKYQAALAIKPDARYPKEMLQKTATGANQLQTEQEKYDAALASAEGFLKNKEYNTAIESFKAALAIKPNESYPKTKISDIEKLIANEEAAENAYRAAIKNADEALTEKKYDVALKQYNIALSQKPSEAYPAAKINEINTLLASEKITNTNYQLAIADADKLFNASKYSESIVLYQKALELKPNEKYPSERINEAQNKADELKSKDENYAERLRRADAHYAQKEMEPALKAYSEALALKPAEKYPKDKVEEISKLLAKEKAESESYNQFLTKADEAYTQANLNQALTAYKEALKIRPDATHPAERITEINQTLALQKETESNYNKAIADADSYYTSKEYDKALESYALALRVKPGQAYPIAQTEKINQMLAAARSLEENYTSAIKMGDEKYNTANYPEAIQAYTEALKFKKNESYPIAQITKINTLLAEKKKLDDAYASEIAIADKLFETSKYTESIPSYTKALNLKPSETYAANQINEARNRIAGIEKTQQEYQAAIAEGDAKLIEKQYIQSIAAYENALTKKPAESYPKQKIGEITKILDKDKADNTMYAENIAKADASYDAKKWEDALQAYKKASSLKPLETYPTQRIELVNTAIAAQQKLDNDYLTEVASADKQFDDKNYSASIATYKKAQVLKPNEEYPAQKIAEAEKEIATIALQQKEYDAALAQAEAEYTNKVWTASLLAFEKASKIKPSENYPKQKISELTLLIDKEKGLARQYEDAIKLADDFFNSNKLREALEPYQRAATLKANEKYPQEQITRINQMIAEQQKKDDSYASLMAQAEKQYADTKLLEARASYAEALKIKPNEKQAVEMISRIDATLAEQKAKEENYAKAIEQANNLYAQKELKQAIPLYEEALKIKPAEAFPTEKLEAIRKELKAIDDGYANAIAAADAFLSGEKYQEAISSYQKALEVKKDEAYPKKKIEDINTLLSARKEEQQQMYSSFVAEGDRLFALKDYYGARTEFTKASGLKPEESYPKQKLEEANGLIKQIEESRQAEYRKAVGEADKLYSLKVYDQAIEAYEAVLKLNIPDPYPENQIAKIKKYLDEHAIQDLNTQALIIAEGDEKKFTFSMIEPRLRKNNYIVLKARSTGSASPKVYLNYGRDGMKNGGIVLRSLDKKEISDYLIRISVQDKWYREDNNWISLFVETGTIEITKVQIAAGD